MDAGTTFPASALELFTTDAASRAPLERAVRRLEADAALLERILERTRAEVPSYAALPPGEYRPGVAGNLSRGLRALAEQRPPSPDELAGAERVGAASARQGIPVEAMLHAFQVATREALGAFAEAATDEGAPPAVVLRATQAGWAWATFVMAAQAQAHRAVELERVRRDDERRGTVLRALLAGDPAPDAASVLGLPAAGHYVAFRLRGGDGLGAATERALRATGAPFALTLLDGDVAGLATDPPSTPDDATAGIGPAATLADAPASFAAATRALHAAATLGLAGAHTLDTLGLLAAVAADRDTGERLRARYLGPLAGLGRLGPELEHTLRAWLDHGRHVNRTAAALHVHPNTLRHRLERYAEAAAVDLEDSRAIAELWWAVQDASAGPRRPPGRTSRPACGGAP